MSYLFRLLAGVSGAALSLAAFTSPALAQDTAAQSPPPQSATPPSTTAQTSARQKGSPQRTAPPVKAAPAGRETPSQVEDLTVQAAPQSAVRVSIDRRSYSVSTDLKGANGSLADALRNVPGAEVSLDGNLTLRGGAVQIMIDGQPSQVFSGPQAAQALQSMPADRIERVEVINNPSAAFSPEGQAGIINLITKKQAPSGVSGGVRANAGTSGHDNASGNFVYQNGKLTVLGDAGWQVNRQKYRITTTGTVADPITGQNDRRTQTEIQNPPNTGWSLHNGFTYQMDPKTQLAGDLRYQQAGAGRYDNITFLTTTPAGAPLSAYVRNGFQNVSQRVSSEQLTWRRQLPGQDHTLALFYNHSLTQLRFEQPSATLTTAPAPPLFFYQDQLSKVGIDVHQFKIDYTRPMPKMGQLKAGYDLRNTDGRFNNFALFGSGAPATATINPLYTNVFNYGQMVNAEYVTYEQPIGDFTVQGGLRLEEEHLSLDQITQSAKAERDNVGVFPTLHLGYRQTSNVSWILNYSLRIQRPNPQSLNPYRNLTDPVNIQAGNPDLKNEETHSFEAGWQYRKAATSYLATLFYRQSEHTATNVVTDLGNGVLLNTAENVASGKVGGLELVAAGPLGKTLSYNLSANFSYTQLETPVLGVRHVHEGFNAGGRASINWQVTKKDLVQVIGIINQGRIAAQSTTDPLFILAAGYRHTFNDKWSLLLQTQDPFDTIHQYTRLTGNGLNQNTDLKAHIQTFMIGFTYNFGASTRARPNQQGFDVGGSGL